MYHYLSFKLSIHAFQVLVFHIIVLNYFSFGFLYFLVLRGILLFINFSHWIGSYYCMAIVLTYASFVGKQFT